MGFCGPSVFLHALHEGARLAGVWLISAAITLPFPLLSALIVGPAAGAASPLRPGGGHAGRRHRGRPRCAGLQAFAPVPWLLFPAALVSGAGWAATSTAAINAMVAPWFERRRPAALSMAYNGAEHRRRGLLAALGDC